MSHRYQMLELAEPLRRNLAAHRLDQGLFGTPTSSQSAVGAVENALDVRLPRALVGTLASMERDLHQVVVFTEDARERGLASNFVAFAYDDDEEVFWCVQSDGANDPDPRVTSWPATKTAPARVVSLSEWVGWSAPNPRVLDAEQLEEVLASVTPRLSFDLQAQARRHVTHPRFGSGVVLESRNDGRWKLHIDFGAQGKRWILADYVHDVPGATDTTTTKKKPSRARRSA